jgi:hypothetical protein
VGRFTTVDPVVTLAENLADPQRWNRYAYVRNNPLRYTDPDGREIQTLDALALERVRSTLPVSLRSAVVTGRDGLVDKDVLNAIRSDDANLVALRSIANDPALMQVETASGASMGKLGMMPFDFKSEAQVKAEIAAVGGDISKASAEGFLGVTDRTGPSTVKVTLSNGTGPAAGAPAVEHAVTAAHEMYGHGLPMMRGKPSGHEPTYPKGPVNQAIAAIEARTHKLYEKQ